MSAPRHAVQAFVPATFLERGAVVPFTAPALSGTRVRPADRGGTELIVPSPAGGRGLYILPWTGLRELFRPTVHDVSLCESVQALGTVTPKAIRRASREVAAGGWAGREASAAAGAAEKADAQAALVANFHLLLRLVEQVEQVEARAPAAADMEQRARQAVAVIAPGLGQSTDAVAETLEGLSAMFADLGLGAEPGHEARLPRLATALAETRDEVASWVEEVVEDEAQSIARLFVATADMTLACAEPVVRSARALAGDVRGLLRRHQADPEAVVQEISRPDWLLDGWEPICLLWREAADGAQRRAALHEIVALLPLLPKEASLWAEMDLDDSEVQGLRRQVRIGEDWRSGLPVFDAVARNERLRSGGV